MRDDFARKARRLYRAICKRLHFRLIAIMMAVMLIAARKGS